jgi:Cu/Ag efflux pump CusA
LNAELIIDFSLKNRLLVCILAVVAVVIGGARPVRSTPFPIRTGAGAGQHNRVILNPRDGAQITLPVELAISGLPGCKRRRSRNLASRGRGDV